MEGFMNDIFAKECYHLSNTWGEFVERMGETYTEEEKEDLYAHFINQTTYEIKVKKK